MPRFCAVIANDRSASLLPDLTDMTKRVSSSAYRQSSETNFVKAELRTFVSDNVALGLTQNVLGEAEFFEFGKFTAVGEVTLDNRREIRSLLKIQAPTNCSDGELLLRCYAEQKTAAFEIARGMFALVIHDDNSLLLIRDAIGARTCFYARARDAWAVSSSLKALRRWPKLDVQINLSAVRSFLTFAYLPGDETLLENVYELLPGHALKIFSDGTSELINYYEPSENFDRETSVENQIKRLREILEQATAERLPAAREDIGVFLSGGIDSSLVTALAVRLHSADVHTYSISFGDDLPNETAYSALVAAYCRTTHHVLSFNERQIAVHLAEAVAELDCPVGDPLTVPNLLLSRAAAKTGLQVILNGEGGDPCFGGPKNLPMLIGRLQPNINQSLARVYLRSYRKCYDDLPLLLTPEVQKSLRDAPPLERLVQPFLESTRFDSYLNRLLYTNIRTKLAHHILPKIERLTSSCGLLGRAPLADKRVVDFSFQIPPDLKLSGVTEKWILKEAVRDLLPSTVVDRPKSGMRVPVQQWLHGALRNLCSELLLGKRARDRGLFQLKTVRGWMRGEHSVYARQGSKLWLLLTLELWLRAFVDSRD